MNNKLYECITRADYDDCSVMLIYANSINEAYSSFKCRMSNAKREDVKEVKFDTDGIAIVSNDGE